AWSSDPGRVRGAGERRAGAAARDPRPQAGRERAERRSARHEGDRSRGDGVRLAGVTRYRFFAGKGGVGKTTCAAAFALRLSRGARTLVVSTDPAHSLGDALAMKLSPGPRAVRGRLFAAEMDADRALPRWLG